MTCRVSRVPACLPTLAAVLESGDGVEAQRIFGSVEFNGVDSELVNLNALPAGECTVALWLKWSALVTTFRIIWETNDGLGAGVRLGGGKAADSAGGTSWEGVMLFPSGAGYDNTPHIPPYAWQLWAWSRAPGTDKWTLDNPLVRHEFSLAGANPVGVDRMTFGFSGGSSSPHRVGGKIARMWIKSGPGSFADAATVAAWRADPNISVDSDYEWRPGAPGDTTSLIKDHVGGRDLTGSGGLVLGSDKP
jgi:hypothetical protein